jgi:proteic killer suppression protein
MAVADIDASPWRYNRCATFASSYRQKVTSPKRACAGNPVPASGPVWIRPQFADHNALRYDAGMIKSFRDKDTEQLFARQFVRRFPPDLHKTAWRKLAQIDAAERLEDLRIPPGNRLERLSEARADQHSIRINAQWRICFRWQDGDAYAVEVTDYH